MESMNDALKYVVQAKNILIGAVDELMIEEVIKLLDQAEEALVKAK